MNKTNTRNFAIIAHVDHGKSTLADRLLEKTETVSQEKMQEQFLDQNPISRERGITIKLAPVRMNYRKNSEEYILNLIDTPGHVDFSYEVSRTLAACEGAILLVDATQGVQAQTVAHYHSAVRENLFIVPAINKIDLPEARTEEVEKQLLEMFSIEKADIIYISAKTGQNVDKLLDAVIDRIPPPEGSLESPFKALIFDAFYDEHRGVIVYTRIFDGSLKKGERIGITQSKNSSIASEVGYFTPFLKEESEISAGDIGYIVTGIKDIRLASVGDTIHKSGERVSAMPGYSQPKPMVFFGMYPRNTHDLQKLKESLHKISLNDTSISFIEERSSFLGSGFRVGFLGLLHAEIVKERIERESNLDILLTMPHVLYEEGDSGIKEPYIELTIYSPKDYVGAIINLCETKKGNMLNLSYYQNSAILKYELPYTMLVRGLSSDLKSISSGYATIDYELAGFRQADLVDLRILINGVDIDVLSEKVYRDEAMFLAREKTKKLKETLPKKQFRQIIQAAISGNIVAREEVPAFRKDVLSKMSGGDRTRKDKLLDKQKKGKQKLLVDARVTIPQEVLFSMIRS